MTLDKDRIAQYLEAIERLLRDWEENSKTATLSILQNDRKTCLFLLYVMEGTIQTSLDLANHIIATFGWQRPAYYRESFEILRKQKWLSARAASKMQELAGFRNILVHQYPDLDLKKALPHVRNSWKTVHNFSRIVASKTLRR